MQRCDVPIKFPLKAIILDSDFPPFDKGRKLVMRKTEDGKVKIKMGGSGVKFQDGEFRDPIGEMPGKIVVVFTFRGQDHHLVITRIKCGKRTRDCGVIVKLGDDRGVGTWVSEEDE